jgi:hypothetical protein
MKNIILKANDPIAKRLQKGTVVQMSDGWKGKVESDDGEFAFMIRDGGRLNNLFVGYRGFQRCSIKVGSNKVMTRSVIVDLAARKVLNRSVTVIDRARLEAEWNCAPGYN